MMRTIMSDIKEYAFDVKLWATARVKATSEKDAREKMRYELEGITVGYASDDITLGEASIESPDEDELIEIDGVAV
jgi:hypothetical protein